MERATTTLLAVALLSTVVTGLMEMKTFTRNIRPICFNKTDDQRDVLVAGQPVPMANSIETFLSILEHLESSKQFSTPAELLGYILSRYRIDDLRYYPPANDLEDTFQVVPDNPNTQDLIKRLLDVRDTSSDEDDQLTDGQKCSLFYMLSHTVNDTAKAGDQNQAPAQYTNARSKQKFSYSQTPNPREQGVVSIRSNEMHAIALGRVLMGVLAGLKKPDTDSLKGVFDGVKKDNSDAFVLMDGNTRFNYVHAATMSEVVTLIIINLTKNRLNLKFGGKGTWNSTLCTTEFKLDSNFDGYATYSMFRGAADGLFLGLQVKQLMDSNRDLKLSQLFRMYYSIRGVPGTSSPSLSYCNRASFIRSQRDEISNQAAAYANLFSAVYPDINLPADNTKGRTEVIMSKFYSSFSDIFDGIFESDDCDAAAGSSSNPICETPSDVFFVLDTRSNVGNHFQTEQEVVSKVTRGLDLRPEGSSVSVYSSVRRRRSRNDGIDLYDVVVNSTSGGCPGCKTAWFTATGMTSMDDTKVIEDVDTILKMFEGDREQLSGVPGKFLVYFNYGSPRDDYSLKTAINNLHRNHRDVPILTIGTNKNELQKFVRDNDKDVIISTDSSNIADILLKRIYESPATLQYFDCDKRSDSLEAANVYEGFVTPNHVQYWAMYPEYFLKSFTIKMSFSSEGGDIKVCFSRYESDLRSRNAGTCKDATSNGSPVEFIIKNPCKKRTVYNCDPFFFSVTGKESSSDSSTKATCNYERCKYTDQIQFKVSHTGVSCNGAGTFVTSFLLISLLALLAICSRA